MKRFSTGLLFACLMAGLLPLKAEPVRAALFVADRITDPVFAGKADAFTDLLAAQLAKNGIAVADKRDTVEALRNYQLPNKKDADDATKLDVALENESSALALARAMGVDCIVSASLTAYDTQKREFNGYGVISINEVHLLYTTVRLLTIRDGASLCGVTAVATQTVPERTSLKVTDANITAPIMAEAAQKLAEAIAQQTRERAELIAAAKAPQNATFHVRCVWADLLFPEVIKNKEGEYYTTKTRYPVDVLSATVELNGVVAGSAPADISAPIGLSTLKITREGFTPWSRMINVTEGLSLTIALQLDEKGLARWKEMAKFIQELKDDAKLTDAQVRVLDGYAQMLRQSGVRINQKENINVNTTDGLIQNYNQGLIQTPGVVVP